MAEVVNKTENEIKIYNAIVESLIEINSIDNEDDLIHMRVENITRELDSLDMLEFVMTIEKKLGISVKDEKIDSLKNMNMDTLILTIQNL